MSSRLDIFIAYEITHHCKGKRQATLKRLLEEPTAQFLAVYGRRRIGKTFLIREYFDDNFAFRHTAISPLELENKDEKLLYRIQLEEFAHSLEKYGAQLDGPLVSWFDAFHKLEDMLDRKRSKKKMVVFIDEMPWLAKGSNNNYHRWLSLHRKSLYSKTFHPFRLFRSTYFN